MSRNTWFVASVLAATAILPQKGLALNSPDALSGKFVIKNEAFHGSLSAFEPHSNYVAMTLPYTPTKLLFEELSKKAPVKLITRGESHVTVLTPPEFDQLKSKLTIDEINSLMAEKALQKVELKPVCLGRGKAVVEGSEEQTYFIVLQSKKLIDIRRAIANTFRARGGSRDAFDPDHFYPHITLGFTKMDLHEQNAVIKNRASCVSSLRVTN